MEHRTPESTFTGHVKTIYVIGTCIALFTSTLYLFLTPSFMGNIITYSILGCDCLLDIYLWRKYLPEQMGTLMLHIGSFLLFFLFMLTSRP